MTIWCRADEEPELTDRWTIADQDNDGYVSYPDQDPVALFVVAGHGFLITHQPRHPIGRTVICFCGSPVIYPRRGIACDCEPWGQWSTACEIEPSTFECECNGCLLDREPATKPRTYCSDKCKVRMRLAMNRVRRRAEGRKTRVVDELADPIAEMVVSRNYVPVSQ